MFIVGLTGGIATGKSTVSKIFKELGCQVIDADQIAREGRRFKANRHERGGEIIAVYSVSLVCQKEKDLKMKRGKRHIPLKTFTLETNIDLCNSAKIKNRQTNKTPSSCKGSHAYLSLNNYYI